MAQYKLQDNSSVKITSDAKPPRNDGCRAPTRCHSVNISEPFIQRPIATSLLMVGVIIMGMLGYFLLPISALAGDFPTIR